MQTLSTLSQPIPEVHHPGNHKPRITQVTLKCVIVGDVGVGKSSIVRTFLWGEFSPPNSHTTKDDYSAWKRTKDASGNLQKIKLDIIDTGGETELDRLRPLCYEKADVFILCFSVVVPGSLQNILTKWMPEIKRHSVNRDISLILCGTQSDLRSNTPVLLDLWGKGLAPVTESQAFRMASKIGAKSYIECSALARRNLNKVFDHTLTWTLQRIERNRMASSQSNNSILSKYLDQRLITLIQGKGLGKDVNRKDGLDFDGLIDRRPIFSRQWRQRKSLKLKRLTFLSCIFH